MLTPAFVESVEEEGDSNLDYPLDLDRHDIMSPQPAGDGHGQLFATREELMQNIAMEPEGSQLHQFDVRSLGFDHDFALEDAIGYYPLLD